MALDLSKLNFFSRLGARARILVLALGVVGFVLVIYGVTKYFSGSSKTIGPSSVAAAPQGLQSVPGGKLTPEYYRALMQANEQAAQQAKMSGGSAIPTLVNVGTPAPTGNCNIICSDQNAKVNTLLDDWVRQGKISPDVASQLEQLADQNVPVSQYAASLDQLVKEGKLTPEQARELLAQYQKQHANALLQESAGTMDGLIKSGQLPLDVANQLLQDQKNGMPVGDYAAELQKLVKEGKISPTVAQQLLDQYKAQQAKEAKQEALATIAQMEKSGEISPDVAKSLTDLAAKNLTPEQYAAEIQKLVAQGKLTPLAASKLIAAYNAQHAGLAAGAGVNGTPAASALDASEKQALQQLYSDLYQIAIRNLSNIVNTGVNTIEASEMDAVMNNGIDDGVNSDVNRLAASGVEKIAPNSIGKLVYVGIEGLVSANKLSANDANRLKDLIAKNASTATYTNEVNNLVMASKLTHDDAQNLINNYQTAKSLQDAVAKHASPNDYSATVNAMLQQGRLTQEVAASLVSDYQGAAALKDMAEGANVSADQYSAAINNFVTEGILVPADASMMVADYSSAKALKDLANAHAMQPQYSAAVNDLLRQAKISRSEAAGMIAGYQDSQSLRAMAGSNVPVAQFAAAVNNLAAQGKTSPDKARLLVGQYQAVQGLKDLAVKNTPLDQYSAAVNDLVSQGKLDWSSANRMIADYSAKQNLKSQVSNNATADQYKAALGNMIGQGQLSQADSDKLLSDYSTVKQLLDSVGQNVSVQDYTSAVNQLVQQGRLAATQAQAINTDYNVAKSLRDMVDNKASVDQFIAAVNGFQSQGSLSAEEAQRLMNDYKAAHGLEALSSRLAQLRASNATAAQYADALKEAVAEGLISPDQAAQLLQEYQSQLQAATAANTPTGTAATSAFAAIQQREAQQGGGAPAGVSPEQFAAAQAQAAQQSDQDRLARLQAIEGAMSGQAQQLIAAWQPPVMEFKAGVPPETKKKGAGMGESSASSASGGGSSSSSSSASGPVLIKAGTIIFAVLDTAVNSDYPDSPVIATIVEGKYKGDKVLGKLQTTKGVSGQQDRIMLNFTLMNDNAWPASKNVTAYGIDPDTARSVLASDVNYHYLTKYGAIMATSFVQGYANAIQSSSSTSTTGIFGTSTTHPELSPGQKLATAIGQIGTNLGSMTQNYTNIPPTVTVNSGVSLGILFMADLS